TAVHDYIWSVASTSIGGLERLPSCLAFGFADSCTEPCKETMKVSTLALSLAVCWLGTGIQSRPDILIADFEGKDYGAWTVAGEAFGPGPARGALPDQMPVSGFQGKGLVNSYLGGDGAVGTLTSPSFKIERKAINFLIGGGEHPGETCINLIVDGKTVRTSTGKNNEHLEWDGWDV